MDFNFERNWPLYRVAIGFIYWCVNIFIRKMHKTNDPDDGWFLSTLWLMMWPICLIGLGTLGFIHVKNKILARIKRAL